MGQIALPLTLRAESDPSSIVVGTANAAVVDALQDPSGWPFGTAIMTGAARSGKSLLGTWFAKAGHGTFVDDADRLDEMEVFHTWNRAQEAGAPLLLVVSATPWTINLPDLRSRLGAAMSLEITEPDEAMLGALAMSHAARRGLALGEDALTYLLPRAERSFAAIERLVAEIDRISLERKSPPSLVVWRAALEAVQGPDQARLF